MGPQDVGRPISSPALGNRQPVLRRYGVWAPSPTPALRLEELNDGVGAALVWSNAVRWKSQARDGLRYLPELRLVKLLRVPKQ
jgi:hypothetical protein